MRRDPFQAAADPNRRKIIEILAKEGALTMNQLAEKFEISRPAVSKHVKILQKSGVIDINQIRVERYCSLNYEGIKAVFDWAAQYKSNWEEDNKDQLPAKQKKNTPKKKKTVSKKQLKPVQQKEKKPKKPTAKKGNTADDDKEQLSLF